jgi:hypothetical protein
MSRPKRYTPLASVVSRDAHDRCVVTGCLRRPMAWGGAYCTRHHHRAFENGHVNATVVTIRELAQFYSWIDDGLKLLCPEKPPQDQPRPVRRLCRFAARLDELDFMPFGVAHHSKSSSRRCRRTAQDRHLLTGKSGQCCIERHHVKTDSSARRGRCILSTRIDLKNRSTDRRGMVHRPLAVLLTNEVKA